MNVSSEVCLIQIEDKEKINTFYIFVGTRPKPTHANKEVVIFLDRQTDFFAN